MNELKSISTRDLVEELKNREGVATTTVEPYGEKTVIAEGPAVVLTVVD